MPDPALILRRVNVSRQGGSRQHEDYDVFHGAREVGRIYLIDSDGGNETWFWGVSFQVTGTLDEAKAAFRAEYEGWHREIGKPT
jgi:hypothetical protein